MHSVYYFKLTDGTHCPHFLYWPTLDSLASNESSHNLISIHDLMNHPEYISLEPHVLFAHLEACPTEISWKGT